MAGPGRVELAAAMGSPSVAAGLALAQVARRCPGPTISLRSVTCVRAVSTSRSASAYARASGRDLHGRDTSAGQDGVTRCGERPARSRTGNRTPAARSPGSTRRLRICGRVRGPSGFAVIPGEVPGTAAGPQEEPAARALQGHRAVRVGDAGGAHRGGRRVPDLPPGRVGAKSLTTPAKALPAHPGRAYIGGPWWTQGNWHVLATGKPYDDLGADYSDRRTDPGREAQRLIARLQALGHHVTLDDAA